MRVLIGNVHFSPDSFGGATIVAEETARGLQDRGHEVVVFTGTSDPRVPEHGLHRYERWGIPVVAFRVPAQRTVASEYDLPEAADRFSEVLEAVRPDVVHLHALQALGVGLAEAAQARDIPTVVTLHDAWWLCERQFMVRESGQYCGQVAIDPAVCATCVPDADRARERHDRSLAILDRCTKVLAPSRFWMDLMVASGVPAQRAAVNGNGVSRPAPGWVRPPRSGPARLGYVGGLSPVKGYPQLLAALRQIRRSDYELVVVDSFSNLGRSTMDDAQWRVPGLVRVVPGYTAATIDDFFGGLDALLFPSQWKESFGLTVREAALRGVWPIMPTDGGTAETFDAGGSGTVYDRDGGVAALAGALDDYLDRFLELTPDAHVADGIPTFEQQTDELEALLLACCRTPVAT